MINLDRRVLLRWGETRLRFLLNNIVSVSPVLLHYIQIRSASRYDAWGIPHAPLSLSLLAADALLELQGSIDLR